MIESLQETIDSKAVLSRGQRKRMKKKEKLLKLALLEEKMKMDAELVKNRGKYKKRRR